MTRRGEILLYLDDGGRVLTVSVPSERFLVQFEKRVSPRELRENALCVVVVAEDTEGGREGFDGSELKGRAVVDRVAGDEEGERAVHHFEVERFPFGGLPGTVECNQTAVASAVAGGRSVRRRQRLLGEGVEHDAGRRRPRRAVEFSASIFANFRAVHFAGSSSPSYRTCRLGDERRRRWSNKSGSSGTVC